jgi:hypothetical protein
VTTSRRPSSAEAETVRRSISVARQRGTKPSTDVAGLRQRALRRQAATGQDSGMACWSANRRRARAPEWADREPGRADRKPARGADRARSASLSERGDWAARCEASTNSLLAGAGGGGPGRRVLGVPSGGACLLKGGADPPAEPRLWPEGRRPGGVGRGSPAPQPPHGSIHGDTTPHSGSAPRLRSPETDTAIPAAAQRSARRGRGSGPSLVPPESGMHHHPCRRTVPPAAPAW